MNNNLLVWIILLSVLGVLGLMIYLVVEKAKSMEKFENGCQIYDGPVPANPASVCGYGTHAEVINWQNKDDACTNRSAYLKGLTKLSTGPSPSWVPFCCGDNAMYDESWGGEIPYTGCGP